MGSRPVGRPLKYQMIIANLEDDLIYSPASIARYAKETSLINPFLSPTVNLPKAMRRIRLSLGRLSNLHDFPDKGDGHVFLERQAPIPGWFGWRWKELLPLGRQEPEPCLPKLAY